MVKTVAVIVGTVAGAGYVFKKMNVKVPGFTG